MRSNTLIQQETCHQSKMCTTRTTACYIISWVKLPHTGSLSQPRGSCVTRARWPRSAWLCVQCRCKSRRPWSEHTSPPFRFFIPISPFPFLPFLFFFFLQQHFLMMQKQHVRMSKAATTAMAMMAQGGTEENIQTDGQMAHPHPEREERSKYIDIWTTNHLAYTPCHVLGQTYLVRGARLTIKLCEN